MYKRQALYCVFFRCVPFSSNSILLRRSRSFCTSSNCSLEMIPSWCIRRRCFSRRKTMLLAETRTIANSYNPQEYAFVCPEGKLLTYHRLNCNQSTGKHLLCYQASCTFPGRRFRPAFPPLRAHRGGGFGESGRHGDTILNISSVLCKFPPLNDYFHVFMDFLLTIC